MKAELFKLSALAVLVAGSLAACDSSSSSNSAPVAQDVSLGEQRQWVGVQGSLDASDPENGDLSFSFSEDGSAVSQNSEGYYEFTHGLLQFNEADQSFTYIPLTTGPASFEYTADDGDLNATASISIDNVSGDPLAHEQWHLRNTGQTGYAMADSVFEAYQELRIAQGYTEEEAAAMHSFNPDILVPGEDMNVLGAYRHGVTGAGSISVVVDQGMAIAHEDLQANVLSGRSINLLPGATDRTDTTLQGNGGDHGTSVSGLIAAEGWNGLGGRGVSPQASLIAMNYLGGAGTQTDRNYMMVHGMAGSGISTTDNVVTFNRSYGSTAPLMFNTDEIDEEIISYPTRFLRNGLGALNIKSAGNAFVSSGNWPEGNLLCDEQQAGIVDGASRVLGCFDGNWDVSNASFFTISVGAVNSDGQHTSYSTTGSNLLVAAPAGEYGDFEPAMVTTDQTTCTRGYSGWGAYDSFMNVNGAFFDSLGITDFHERVYPFNNPMGDNSDNLNCNYTSTFNGTSSAAPNTSGVVNLIASANPDLNWREIRYILAATATQVSPEDAPVELTVGEGTFVAHPGWVENAAGYSFNNRYGFGRPDAGAAVELALSDSVQFPELIETEWLEHELDSPLEIADNNAEGVTFEVEVEEELTIEGVQFAFSITNADLQSAYEGYIPGTTAASDIAIEVTSPSGTTSVIATSRSSLGAYFGMGALGGTLQHAYHPTSPLLTNAFLGESSVGTWTLRFVDTNGEDRGPYFNNTVNSLVDQVNVRLFGH